MNIAPLCAPKSLKSVRLYVNFGYFLRLFVFFFFVATQIFQLLIQHF